MAAATSTSGGDQQVRIVTVGPCRHAPAPRLRFDHRRCGAGFSLLPGSAILVISHDFAMALRPACPESPTAALPP